MNDLVLPRRRIYLSETGGSLIKFSDMPYQLQTPLKVTRVGPFVGITSGYRSALIDSESGIYKIKGCRPHPKAHGSDPLGSNVLSVTQYEVETLNEMKKIFESNGFEYPIKPVGIWQYDLKFRGESTSAGIYKVKSDTRLDELLFYLENLWLPSEGGALGSIYEDIGRMVGQRLRILHNQMRCWDTKGDASNAHFGNVVVFINDNGYLDLALTDFDDALPVRSSKSLVKETQKWEKEFFIDTIGNDRPASISPFSHKKHHTIHSRMTDQLYHLVGDNPVKNKLAETLPIENGLNIGNGVVLRVLLRKAVEEGYKNPDMEVHSVPFHALSETITCLKKEANKFKRKIKKEFSGIKDEIRIMQEEKEREEKEREYRHWKQFDDCYGFTDDKLVRVAVYDHIPRVRVYENGTIFNSDGLMPKLREAYPPAMAGFKTFPRFGGEIKEMSSDQVEFHLKEFAKTVKWWNADMKDDEGHVKIPRSQVLGIYNAVFDYGIKVADFAKDEKVRLTTLRDSLFSPA